VQAVYPFDSDTFPYDAIAPPLVTEQEHGENEARCQPDILDVGSKQKTTAAMKKNKRQSNVYTDEGSSVSENQDRSH
jgi:hypothetical protein